MTYETVAKGGADDLSCRILMICKFGFSGYGKTKLNNGGDKK